MKSMVKVKSLGAEMLGFCHFGIVSGGRDIDALFADHEKFMNDFRDGIVRAFGEDRSTAHVMKSTEHLWERRFGEGLLKMPGSENFFSNLRLALTYGLMVDLGFRDSKYEERTDY